MTYSDDEQRLLDAGWWVALNKEGDRRYVHPSTPGWASCLETALEWQDNNDETEALLSSD
jgi:hypothetical protein